MRMLTEIVEEMKLHPQYSKAGMVLYHNGVVRESSRDGRAVNGLKVEVDHPRLQEVIERQKNRDGIIEILVEINEGVDLAVGDDVMYIAVAGDIRENVIAVLTDTLNEIKKSVTAKTEYFV